MLIFALLAARAPLFSYSVLSHEALIDTVWGPLIQPLLRERFPSFTEAQLFEAHAYAYGGAVIQDMGYYPFGRHFFSDLAHYVRSGDFVQSLLTQAHDGYEYAFALGALAHYAADTDGHPIAVNRAVAQMYPDLRRKFGDYVTYAQGPKPHVLVEFSFDVAQIAGAGYLPETYHNFIGFKVSKPLLNRAFQTTYGLELKDLFLSEDLAIGTYRRGASEVIPRMTQIAWNHKQKEIQQLNPSMSRKKFVYRLSRANYESEWGKDYRRSKFFMRRWGHEEEEQELGTLARILVFLSEHMPKFGPLQTLKFKPPTPQAQALFVTSFRSTLDRYQGLLKNVKDNNLSAVNENLDTGQPIHAGDYDLADKTYARLLDRLAENHFKSATPELRADILSFYRDRATPPSTADAEEWKKTLRYLEEMQAAPLVSSQ